MAAALYFPSDAAKAPTCAQATVPDDPSSPHFLMKEASFLRLRLVSDFSLDFPDDGVAINMMNQLKMYLIRQAAAIRADMASMVSILSSAALRLSMIELSFGSPSRSPARS